MTLRSDGLESTLRRMLDPLKRPYRRSVLHQAIHYADNRRIMEKAKQAQQLKLHLGCGPEILHGWLNIDERKLAGAVGMPLPAGLRHFADNSVSYVYC